MYFAHSTSDPGRENWQPLADHLRAVASEAAKHGGKFGVSKAALLAGLAHDLGKYTVPFQRRLDGSPERVDHSTAGAQEVMRLAKGGDRGMAEIAASCIAGHHAGLPDRYGDRGSLEKRLSDETIHLLDPVWRNEITLDATGLLPAGFKPAQDSKRGAFQVSFLGRMIFSCLIDADRADTRAFDRRVNNKPEEPGWPKLPAIVDDLIAAFDAHMARKRAPSPNDLNRLRDHILAHARSRAGAERGLFTLTVPTGGGKTLASLAFALDHARHHGLDRIIYAIPFTTVIDQTAAIFRDVLGEGVVLEHHSAIEPPSAEDERKLREREPEAALSKLRLAMEDWAAPVVVTTNVQLFESLFSHRPSRCRKLHNLANSVIVLDEAQTLPRPLLRPCLAAIDELARNYGASIVLCTATQPAVAEPAFKGGLNLSPERELAPEPPKLYEALRRVTVRRRPDPLSDDDLVTELAGAAQGLVIVNTRAHALALYRRARKADLDGVIHLTTRHYAAHRRAILADVRRRLKGGLPCRLIATSLVEAGVDLDFPVGWRAEAGLDSIAQAAGRVNRENARRHEESLLTVFTPAEVQPPPEVASLIGDFKRIERDHGDLLAPDAIHAYFGEVYWREGEGLDRIWVKEGDSKRRESVLGLFRFNGPQLDFAYRTVGETFRLIESGLAPVIVARDEAARRALDALRSPAALPGHVAQALQPYTVQVPPKARDRLVVARHVQFEESTRFGDQFAVLRAPHLYRDEEGLLWEDAEYLDAEQTIF